MADYNEYPKWMHRKGESRVVTEAEAKQAIADGWAVEKRGTAPPPSDLKHPAPGSTKADPSMLDGPEVEVVERITALTDIDVLNALCDFETSLKNRVAVTAACQARVNTLKVTGGGRYVPSKTAHVDHDADASVRVDDVPEPDAPVRRPGLHKTRK